MPLTNDNLKKIGERPKTRADDESSIVQSHISSVYRITAPRNFQSTSKIPLHSQNGAIIEQAKEDLKNSASNHELQEMFNKTNCK